MTRQCHCLPLPRFAVVLLHLAMASAAPVFAQPDDVPLFELDRVIRLSDDALIGDVGSLDMDAAGNIALVEQSGPAAFLFDPRGGLKAELSIADCSPGTPFLPIAVHFYRDGRLLVTDSSVGGLVFDRSGACIGRLDADFRAPLHFTVQDDGRIFSYHYPALRAADRNGATLWQKLDGATRFPGVDSHVMGGGLVLVGDELLLSRPAESRLFRFDLEGNFLGELAIPSRRFREPKKDHPRSGGLEMLSQVHELFSSSSMVNRFHVLQGDTLLFQIGHKQERTELLIYSISQGLIATADYPHHYPPLIHAGNGKAFRVIGARMDENGELGNPSIYVYSFIGPTN